MLKKYIHFLLWGLSISIYAQESSEGKANFFQKEEIKKFLEMRDPFKREGIKLKKRVKSYKGFLQNNSYSNRPVIDGIPLERIRVVGVLLGKERRAIAKVLEGDKLGKDVFILREGMKLGENEAEIKAILPGGIALSEKIDNAYGQKEYIETIIPVSP